MTGTSLAGRSWGDGAGRQAEHVISDISFADGWLSCECGVEIGTLPALTLEDAWDTHRGRTDLVLARALDPEHAPRASNAEVAEFLDAVRNPDYAFGGDE